MNVPEGWIICKGPESFQSCVGHDDPEPLVDTAPSTSKHTQQRLTFLELPAIVVRLILEQLDRASMKEFRLVSSACRRLSEPVIFRKLVLHNRNLSFSSVVASICSRLCDPEDALGEIVHHLQVGPQKQKECYPEEDVLLKSVENISDLRDFTWHMRIAIPEALSDLLHKKHASARIHIINNDRDAHYSDYNIYAKPDYKSLSSLQLHSLSYTAYGHHESRNHMGGEFYSEVSAIKDCLLKARNLKRLDFNVRDAASFRRQITWKKGPKYLSFTDGETLPPLEELVLPSEMYPTWSSAMDWSMLRRLDLGDTFPITKLPAITNKVPQLKVLCFGLQGRGVLDDEVDILRAFLDSIDGLEETTVIDQSPHFFDKVRDQFFSKHGHSLRKLHMRYASPALGMSPIEIEDFAQRCPNVQDLVVQIPEDTNPFDLRLKSAILALQRLKNLHELEVIFVANRNVCLNQEDAEIILVTHNLRTSNGLSGSFVYELKEQLWRERVVSMYQGFQSIESFKSTLRATNWPSCNWLFWVQRQYDDRKRFRVLKNFLQPVRVHEAHFDPWG